MFTTMNRISEVVQKETGLSPHLAMGALDAVVLAIRSALMRSETVEIDGLGIFRVTVRENTRKIKRTQLRASVRFTSCRSLKTKVSKTFCDMKETPVRVVKATKQCQELNDRPPVSRWGRN